MAQREVKFHYDVILNETMTSSVHLASAASVIFAMFHSNSKDDPHKMM